MIIDRVNLGIDGLIYERMNGGIDRCLDGVVREQYFESKPENVSL